METELEQGLEPEPDPELQHGQPAAPAAGFAGRLTR